MDRSHRGPSPVHGWSRRHRQPRPAGPSPALLLWAAPKFWTGSGTCSIACRWPLGASLPRATRVLSGSARLTAGSDCGATRHGRNAPLCRGTRATTATTGTVGTGRRGAPCTAAAAEELHAERETIHKVQVGNRRHRIYLLRNTRSDSVRSLGLTPANEEDEICDQSLSAPANLYFTCLGECS